MKKCHISSYHIEKNITMITRNKQKYEIFKTNTERFKNSSVIRMQTLLNEEENKKQNI